MKAPLNRTVVIGLNPLVERHHPNDPGRVGDCVGSHGAALRRGRSD
jgi:hypothetical protein